MAVLTEVQRAALRRLLESPKYEILPLGDVLPQLAELPLHATLAVTASPGKGVDASLAVAGQLRAAGHDVVVHLAARSLTDGAHLRRLLERMRAADLRRAFVVGGDAASPGAFPDALSMLRELAEAGQELTEVGIGCYPQGHPLVDDARLLDALHAKAPYAQYMTTQLCFDADALTRWVRARRAEGMDLPLDIGVAGAVETARLLRISARIGVTDATRYLRTWGGLVARLLRPGGYRPDSLLVSLAPLAAEEAAGVRGLHIFTFNQVARTDAWRRRFLQAL